MAACAARRPRPRRRARLGRAGAAQDCLSAEPPAASAPPRPLRSTRSACRSTPGCWPPATTDPAGDVIEALTLLRDCWMPEAGLGRDVALSVTENGYATRGGTGEERQAADLGATVDAVARWSGTLGMTDYRYFNLRDNGSSGGDLFDAVGLLFDDYREKPAYGVYREVSLAPPSRRPRVSV